MYYKNSPDDDYVGFIAKDVPDLVAMNDHKPLFQMKTGFSEVVRYQSTQNQVGSRD